MMIGEIENTNHILIISAVSDYVMNFPLIYMISMSLSGKRNPQLAYHSIVFFMTKNGQRTDASRLWTGQLSIQNSWQPVIRTMKTLLTIRMESA